MAASVTTAAHGVRVVTHIIPLETPEPQCPTESKKSQITPSLPYMTKMFLTGEPVALGTVQVFIGLVMMAMGTFALVAGVLNGEVPLGLGISCIISGAVTLAAREGTSPGLIRSTLVLNIISTLLALVGVCYFCTELVNRPVQPDCTQSFWSCGELNWSFSVMLDGLKGMLLVLSVLEVCVCITLVVFACKSEHQTSVTIMTADPMCQCNQALLNEGEKGALDYPPAYEP
ncbi:membrane-spanning 4-domains subfamily A member 4A [Hoplias malabaricus]|uniref:membrane-spanning 4-domains subfamily A member 4A n=1 Tax=Hoplias malabaricus TaxID=27720 RepID=UPI003462F9B9